ncbi:hypothetical protein GCM10022223_11590 [Kineosporia mesophila]|uniref:SnoaL-like domain-containing protein n=1 Tax=Kineosporia mesophila TaxID=566012 RepID=A0ABP6Z685_9ACTN|nr:nuclear transport factor 2 family protein [Kineosporia mesophila]MCD5352636.1 nuclear transport factor 2 family protein [Kineosporia mesophila]
MSALEASQRLAVQEALARYALALDDQDAAALESVLTEDVSWNFTLAGQGDLGPVAGREAVLGFVRESWTTQTDRSRHYLSNVVVNGEGPDTAAARAYLLMTSDSRVVTTGSYRFSLRASGGEWRIAQLVLGMENAG